MVCAFLVACAAASADILSEGFNTATGEFSTGVVNGDVLSLGADHDLKLTLVTSSSRLNKVLDMQFKAKIGLGIVDVEAKTRFVRNVGVTATSTSLILRAKKVTTRRLRDPRLNEGVNITAAGLDKFIGQHGDTFVVEEEIGGEYIVVFHFKTRTRDEQTVVSASIKISTFFGSIRKSFRAEDIQRDSNTELQISQYVSGIAQPAEMPRTVDEMVDFAHQFCTMEMTDPGVVSYQLQSYAALPSVGRVFDDRLEAEKRLAEVDERIVRACP